MVQDFRVGVESAHPPISPEGFNIAAASQAIIGATAEGVAHASGYFNAAMMPESQRTIEQLSQIGLTHMCDAERDYFISMRAKDVVLRSDSGLQIPLRSVLRGFDAAKDAAAQQVPELATLRRQFEAVILYKPGGFVVPHRDEVKLRIFTVIAGEGEEVAWTWGASQAEVDTTPDSVGSITAMYAHGNGELFLPMHGLLPVSAPGRAIVHATYG